MGVSHSRAKDRRTLCPLGAQAFPSLPTLILLKCKQTNKKLSCFRILEFCFFLIQLILILVFICVYIFH